MLPIFQEIKNKAKELELTQFDLECIFIDHISSILNRDLEESPDFERTKFYKFLLDVYDFKHLGSKGGGEREDSDGYEDRDCESIIELKGQVYKLTYLYRSWKGYIIDDFWNWKPAVKKEKLITYYEPEKPVKMVEKQRTETYYE